MISGAKVIVLAGMIAGVDDVPAEEVMPTGSVDAFAALFEEAADVDLAVLVTSAEVAEPVAEDGSMVVMDTLGSVARLDSRLEAADGSKVNVSEGSVEEGTTVTVTVTASLVVESVGATLLDGTAEVTESEWLLCEWSRVLVAEADSVVLEDACELSSSSPSSQSVGKSIVVLLEFTVMPPVAPVALIKERAVWLVVHVRALTQDKHQSNFGTTTYLQYPLL